MKKHDKIELLDEIKRIENDNIKLLDGIAGYPQFSPDLVSILEKNETMLEKLYEMLNEET